ncbi:MAG: hypothetical protein ABWX61_02495 [Paenisporosarcina sp.]
MEEKEKFPEFEPDHVKKEERKNQIKINENEKHENEKTNNHEFEQHENDLKTTNAFEVDQNQLNDPANDIANKQGRNFKA